MFYLIVITISGICFWPGTSSKRNRLIIIANIIFASNIAKFCPIHERDPAENGKNASTWRPSNRDGSNLNGSLQNHEIPYQHQLE
jgi:hypothetical protein